jgi:hypothetical protein
LLSRGPDRPYAHAARAGDLVRFGAAAHETGHPISNDAVTGAIRAPFTEARRCRAPEKERCGSPSSAAPLNSTSGRQAVLLRSYALSASLLRALSSSD